MSIAEAPERASGNDESEFSARIADETLNFDRFGFEDRKVTGAQVAEAVDARPVTDFVILHQLKSLELETLRPTELADLKASNRFIVVRGDATYNFVVDGLNMTWPQKAITGKTVKKLINKDDDTVELLLEREDYPDKVIADDEEVNIAGKGVEKFKTRPAKITVTIIVEGTPHVWHRPKISYDQVVILEVPTYAQHPEITYSVTYSNGPNDQPTGVLVKGESVRVKDRMIFNVSETGQS
jgi:hypothetical protein